MSCVKEKTSWNAANKKRFCTSSQPAQHIYLRLIGACTHIAQLTLLSAEALEKSKQLDQYTLFSVREDLIWIHYSQGIKRFFELMHEPDFYGRLVAD